MTGGAISDVRMEGMGVRDGKGRKVNLGDLRVTKETKGVPETPVLREIKVKKGRQAWQVDRVR